MKNSLLFATFALTTFGAYIINASQGLSPAVIDTQQPLSNKANPVTGIAKTPESIAGKEIANASPAAPYNPTTAPGPIDTSKQAASGQQSTLQPATPAVTPTANPITAVTSTTTQTEGTLSAGTQTPQAAPSTAQPNESTSSVIQKIPAPSNTTGTPLTSTQNETEGTLAQGGRAEMAKRGDLPL